MCRKHCLITLRKARPLEHRTDRIKHTTHWTSIFFLLISIYDVFIYVVLLTCFCIDPILFDLSLHAFLHQLYVVNKKCISVSTTHSAFRNQQHNKVAKLSGRNVRNDLCSYSLNNLFVFRFRTLHPTPTLSVRCESDHCMVFYVNLVRCVRWENMRMHTHYALKAGRDWFNRKKSRLLFGFITRAK